MNKGFILNCLEQAEREHSRLSKDILNVEGFCPPKIRHFLNNLCFAKKDWETNYLEVGTYKGASLLSASYQNPGKFTAIDNFSEFDGARVILDENLNRFGDRSNIRFIEGDCWSVDEQSIPKNINVYYYDGNHSVESQKRGLIHFNPFLAERFVLMVDDYSWSDSIQGTQQALDELNYKIDLKVELHDDENKGGWWNGLFVLLAEKR